MLRIGLTGGIGSGKSTVSALLARRGAVIIDSDRIARGGLEPGAPGRAAVGAACGPQVLTADGALDRPALAAVVFADPEARRTLDAIVHPLVRARAEELAAAPPGGPRPRPRRPAAGGDGWGGFLRRRLGGGALPRDPSCPAGAAGPR